jgi:hypothetical protein
MIDEIIDKYNPYVIYSFQDLKLGIVEPILDKTRYIPGDRSGNTYADAVPNDRRKSVLYWEDYGTRAVSIATRGTRYMTTARLICWLNMDKINGLSYTNCVREIMRATPRFMPGDRSIYFQKAGQFHKSLDIFARYNYREGKQFITNPFDVFALEFNIFYTINDRC